MKYPMQNERTKYHLQKMGIKINNGDPLQSIILIDRPDKDIRHIHFRILGKEVFRAKVAKLLLKYYPGNGKTLQQLLGDILSNKKKQDYFDKHRFFSNTIIHDTSVDIRIFKHHIVNAFLGFLVEHLTPEELNTYILKYWMNDVWNESSISDWKSLKLFAKLKGLDIENKIITENNTTTIAKIINKKNNTTIVEVEAKSPKYISKKLIKKGILAIKEYESK